MSLTKVTNSMISGAPVNVLDYGAVSSLSASDAVANNAAFQAAITATPSGGLLRIPKGTYFVTGNLTAVNPIRIVGDSMEGTKIVLVSTASATTDVFVFSPDQSAPNGFAISDLNILPESGTPGRYGIHMNGTTFGFNKFLIDRVRCYGLGNYAVKNYGAFSSTIRDSVLSGILMDLCTDNQNILDNTIQGEFWGVYINAVSGTNMFNIRGNVIVSKLGGVYAQEVGTLTIADNQFETQQATTDPDSSMIVLAGILRTIYNTQITGNNFNVNVAYMVSSIKLKNTMQVRIFGNMINTGVPADGNQAIVIESGSYGTIIDQNVALYGGVTADYNISAKIFADYDATYNPQSYVLDSGVGTCGVWKLMEWINFPTISATNYYSTAGGANCIPSVSNFPLPVYRKSVDGKRVEFAGGMALGDKTENKLIFTMPLGFRPVASYTGGTVTSCFPISALVGGGSVYPMFISATGTGELSLRGGTALGATTPGFITLDGGSYQVTYG